MNTSLHIKNLTREEILTHLDALSAILENCVNGGASVSFMLPFSPEKRVLSGAVSLRAWDAMNVLCWPVSIRRTVLSARYS